jgi:hypothetical protein
MFATQTAGAPSCRYEVGVSSCDVEGERLAAPFQEERVVTVARFHRPLEASPGLRSPRARSDQLPR